MKRKDGIMESLHSWLYPVTRVRKDKGLCSGNFDLFLIWLLFLIVLASIRGFLYLHASRLDLIRKRIWESECIEKMLHESQRT
jgi:hypothetical protein